MRRDGLDARARAALRELRGPGSRRDDGARALARDPARRRRRRGRRGPEPRHRSERGPAGDGLPVDGRPARGIEADRHRHDRVAAVVGTQHQRHRHRHDHGRRVLERAAAERAGEAVDAHRAGQRSEGGARRARATPRVPHAVGRGRRDRAREAGTGVPMRNRRAGLGGGTLRPRAIVRAARRRGGLGRHDPAAGRPADGEPPGGVHPVGRRGHGSLAHPLVRRERRPGRDRAHDPRAGPAPARARQTPARDPGGRPGRYWGRWPPPISSAATSRRCA